MTDYRYSPETVVNVIAEVVHEHNASFGTWFEEDPSGETQGTFGAKFGFDSPQDIEGVGVVDSIEMYGYPLASAIEKLINKVSEKYRIVGLER